MKNDSIGIFDSGFGGLTVMRAIKSVLPHENLIYFGDTAHLPYGEKSADAIVRYTLESSRFLIQQGIKMLVIACHTASTAALDLLQNSFDIPVVGVISPSVETVLEVSKGGQIAILGTRATILSGVYQRQIQNRLPHAQITPISCPLFVPIVEEGYSEHPLTRLLVQEYLRPLHTKPIDTLLLACTHYPLLTAHIQNVLGEEVLLVDPATSCAEQIAKLLASSHLENPERDLPHYQFYVSDDPEKFRILGKTFLNYPIEHVSTPH